MSKRARKTQQADDTPPTLRGETLLVAHLDDAASFSPQEEGTPQLVPGKTEGSLSLGQVTLHPENIVQALSQPPREEKVRALAYDLWLKRGSPDGSPEADWLEADRLTP